MYKLWITRTFICLTSRFCNTFFPPNRTRLQDNSYNISHTIKFIDNWLDEQRGIITSQTSVKRKKRKKKKSTTFHLYTCPSFEKYQPALHLASLFKQRIRFMRKEYPLLTYLIKYIRVPFRHTCHYSRNMKLVLRLRSTGNRHIFFKLTNW